ncbi:MAG: ribosome small subunit-dependent GTPase A [Pseudonocardiaceae bacterium]
MLTGRGETRALLPSVCRPAGGTPTVGDWVTVCHHNGRILVSEVLTRHTVLRRVSTHEEHRQQVLAANMDVVFVCFAVRTVNPVLLDALLGVALDSGADPVLLLNKVDVATGPELANVQALLAETDQRWPVVFTSAVTGSGMGEVAALVRPDRTAVFLGASGVGKSTMINTLLGCEAARTGRTKVSGEGRHTTSRRELLTVPGGGAVIDLPGLRSVTPVLDEDLLRQVYEDVAEVAARCRFSDCRHDSEPDCAVRDAVASGQLSADRVERERRMERAARQQQLKADKRLAAEAHREVVVRAKAARRRRRGR